MTEKFTRWDSADYLKTEEQTTSYDRWFRTKVQEAIDSSARRIPHDQVMAKMDALITTLKQK